jgi:hypothetical protein
MTVPEQVRKQTEEVQKLYAELENDGASSPGEGEDGSTNVQENALPSNVSEVAPPPETEELNSGEDEETYQQKYQTLQGMFNAEVPRLTSENTQLSERLSHMEQLFATMQAAPAPEPAPAPKPASTLTEAELEEWGESIDIMRKVSQETAGAHQQQIAGLEATIQQLQGTVIPRVEQIAGQQAQTTEQIFWSNLSLAVPEWEVINDNQDFRTWLLEVDPLTGYSKQAFLDSATNDRDADRVAGFFTSWQRVNGTSQAQPNRSDSNSELERQITPGRSRGGGLPTGNQSVTYSPKEIESFYDAVRKGEYKGKEEERDKLERDIFAAQAEGRIVNA